jgi:hypothetical protein
MRRLRLGARQRGLGLAGAVVVIGLAALAGCAQEEAPESYVARVGPAYLSQERLSDALTLLPPGADSAEARAQVIEEWVTNQVLVQEATRRGLRDDPYVRRVLEENEQSVLIAALVDELLAEPNAVPQSALRAYYDANSERMRLREPYVRVRYLETTSEEAARQARSEAQRAVRASEADSLWPVIARRFARDAEASIALAKQFVPLSQLLPATPQVAERVQVMRPGEIAPPIEADSAFHVVQLVRLAPEGSVPEYEWVEAEVRQRVAVEQRKQRVARQVQRLRNEAQARGALNIPIATPPDSTAATPPPAASDTSAAPARSD